jgi:N-acetyl-anhydromuramoyl-L-alanine amidase
MNTHTPDETPEADTALWQAGWYRFARKMPSPNFGPRPSHSTIDLVVIHAISLPPGQFGGDYVQQLFMNQLDWAAHPYFKTIEGLEVSSHFYIRRDGALWQFVSADDRAWHAGTSHYRGRDNCNDDAIGIELEGAQDVPFEETQYETLSSLIAALPACYPIAHIAGHEHIAPGRKWDPGRGFNWAQIQQSLAWPAQYFPGVSDTFSGL